MILQRQPMADLDEKQYTSSNSVEKTTTKDSFTIVLFLSLLLPHKGLDLSLTDRQKKELQYCSLLLWYMHMTM